MAGKHRNVSDPLSSNPETLPPIYPGYRDDKAYSEGRQDAFQGGIGANNPHTDDGPEFRAWNVGFFDADVGEAGAAGQIQTCYAGSIVP
jgi:hypothetical protein